MFKLTPSANSQRSTPKSYRRLSSISHSNGEVLMNDYFNLPMVSTKSTFGNYGVIGFKPNTISVIGDYDENNQQFSQENNKRPTQMQIVQGENSQDTTNYDILEKYYQNKAITTQRRMEVKKTNTRENIREVRNLSLQKKNVQNLDKLNESQKYSSGRNYIIRENQFKQNNNDVQFSNIDYGYQQKTNTIEMISKRIENSKRTLKKVFLSVFFSMVISKKYRLFKQEEKQIITILNCKLQSCQKVINQIGIRQVEEQQQQFVQIVSNKVIHYLNNQTYINECNQNDDVSNPVQSMDWKKLRVQSFSKLIYQNLELLTRECNFPELLKCQLITSLYKTSKQQTSFFVGERCHFYQANRIQLTREQKLAIAMEYLLFQIVIPKLLQIVNGLPTYSQNHKIYTQQIIVIIASLLHRQFVNRFQNMKKVKNPNGYMVNKKLSIQYLENGLFCNEISIAGNTGDNNEVLEGLLEQDQIQSIENSKPVWKQSMDNLFDQILSNVQDVINF
ncbi:unnamed protein product (macronuclear) [Paramecium tetraurelia]|uniref:Uncharacterized protein n=1 Tax=Paramecium tetraurelia TaxID=5888 RepID=A0E539_PARTE|nr:uncharacterized protein GSPATT00023583001 [Paramecium tetraurelia]CAK90406.1 unnamed protein product [Paramecium tetraurelia]|eukprot:XP_001457803.1 hypothetical protein (macronuclear) [Paramecium tetraurelia strain d4-2]